MKLSSHLFAIAGLALVAGCAQPSPDTNVVTIVETGDDNLMVPESNFAASDAANVAEAASANATEAPSGRAVNISPDGVALVDLATGSSRHLPFGMERDRVVPMIVGVLGNPTDQGVNQECGAGPLAYVHFKGSLSLQFQEGKFVGWGLDSRDAGKYSTFTGVGIGSTRAELEKLGKLTLEESSLGHEFTFGGISGLLDGTAPGAKVTDLWAGTDCIFR